MTQILIGQDPLTLNQLRQVLNGPVQVELTPAAWANVEKGAATVAAILDEGRTVYGINTGFGLLANTSIAAEDRLRKSRRDPSSVLLRKPPSAARGEGKEKCRYRLSP